MKRLSLLLLSLCLISLTQAQTLPHSIETHTDVNGLTYETVTNDPLQARIYTLPNGLKVYLTVYKDAPRIQTFIAVRAGSKNDPSTATGLAHYLEHMLFKGTDHIGTTNWEKEKAELDKIQGLYDLYRTIPEKDSLRRRQVYHQIDSISVVASQYSIANEYDKMLSQMGASGTNAYTFVEQTVYVNDIPSNQIDRWAAIESERFRMVAPRLFHTELEAVYEEKNKGMDQDGRKVWEAMLAGLFPTHQYGTQTTIGTVEHLKNPSITEILNYFGKYYRPNNMAICLSGDFDPDSTIKIIHTRFSGLQAQEIPLYQPPVEKSNTAKVVKDIYGPDAENVVIAFRVKSASMSPGVEIANKPDAKSYHYMKIISMLLNNGQAGLIDLNLNHEQLILGGYAYDLPLNDYNLLVLGGKPREGQTLAEVEKLLYDQIIKLQNGEFPDWLIQAVLNDYRISKMKEYETNKSRAEAFVDAFTSGRTWADYISDYEYLSSISQKDVIAFAQQYLNENYVVVYKHKGIDTTIHKVPKPPISAVELNRELQSDFYKKTIAMTSPDIAPVFLNYEKEISKAYTQNKTQILYKKNEENGIFNLYVIWDFGKEQDMRYAIAAQYFNYLGTDKYSPEQIQEEFYKLGATYALTVTTDNIYFTVSGLQENFHPTVELFEHLINHLQPDSVAWNSLREGILRARKDQKLNKDVIHKSAMVSYAKYGTISPFTSIVPEKALMAMNESELVQLLQQTMSVQHRILYYGPSNIGEVTTEMNRFPIHQNKPVKLTKKSMYTFQPFTENKVYWVNYNMVQAEVLILSKSVDYNATLVPVAALYNEYFGGGMGSLVFTELRESRALAYSVYSRFTVPTRYGDPNYDVSYIGTQSDKIHEAMNGMLGLVDSMHNSIVLFDNSKGAMLEQLRTQRITKASVLFQYINNEKLHLKKDIRKDMYDKILVMDYKDIEAFQQKYIKGQKRIILVIGSKDRIDFNSLSKYGKVQELTLEEIFGY